jgi:histidinol-phosphate aminotransferase
MANWRDNLRKVEPYTPGEQPKEKDIIKLNTNENPYPPAPGVMQAMMEMDGDLLRRYPDPTAGMLVDAIARRYGVERDQVFVGVGSDDVIAMAFMSFFNSEKPIFFPDITYSFYPVWADLFKVPYETKALDENFAIRAEDYYGENGGVIFPNPNAPTSRYEDLSLIEDILQHNQDCVVIVDEAYIDFAGESALSLIDRYENLLVVQTFSKSRSMAGMRIGYAIGSPELIKAMSDVKYSFNSYTMNQTSLCMGKAAIEDEDYFQDCIRKIRATRDRSKEEFAKLGFSYIEPGANFIFVTHPRLEARRLFQQLRENHIYVRYFDKPRISDYLRVTIGTDEEMDALFAFLRRIINES